MQSLLEEMGALLVKIKAGDATIGELEAFAAAASQLNERAVILRYKAYEAKVFGTELSEKSVAVIDDIAEDGQLDNFSVEEVMQVDETSSNFEEEANEDSFSFDLFGNEEEAVEPKVELFNSTEDTSDELEDEPDFEEEIPEAVEVPIIETETPTPSFQETHVKFEETVVEPKVEVVEEIKLEEKSEPVVSPISTGDLHPIYNRVPTDMNSLSARIWQVRIESLRGAFGFNERMQSVNELFQGSLEAFTSAIDELDTISDKSTARSKVTALANQYNWSTESEIGLDFVQKVERKYA
ncbi:MAG: hypothetical protein ACK46Y_15240 [Fluviicola sp.]